MQKLEILSTTSVFYKISSKILLFFPFYLDESVLTIFPNYLERIDIFPIFAAENNRAYVKEMNGKSNLTDEEMKEVMNAMRQTNKYLRAIGAPESAMYDL